MLQTRLLIDTVIIIGSFNKPCQLIRMRCSYIDNICSSLIVRSMIKKDICKKIDETILWSLVKFEDEKCKLDLIRNHTKRVVFFARENLKDSKG